MKNLRVFVLILATAATVAAGCNIQHASNSSIQTLQPSAVIPSLLGSWMSTSISALPGAPATCSSFQWTVTTQTETDIAGKFSASCAGGVTLSGTASGHIDGTSVPITVSGTASLPGLPSCAFSLSGTGIIQGESIVVPYTGTTCLGPVSGTETLRRSYIQPPSPPVPPAPPVPPRPPTPPPATGTNVCDALVGDKDKLIACIHAQILPRTIAEAFEVTKRVAWALRGEGAGLLIKNGGENIVSWKGYSFSAGRICYPDGHIYKVLSDVGDGGANGPSWQDNGFVERNLYLPAINPY